MIAARRQADAPRLIHLVRGDLDWIVMKCLEKDRKRRYDTANGLALDLERHLKNEIVTARPPTAGYLLSKLVRRNKLAFAAGAAIAASLVVGIAVSMWQAVRANRAFDELRASGGAWHKRCFMGSPPRVRPAISWPGGEPGASPGHRTSTVSRPTVSPLAAEQQSGDWPPDTRP